ncbi:Cobalt-precorrin-6 synthase, anaerobic [invertebrate metagenome]|uniref:Cobalt-precorrin-6 synthase, anaerobic n=1 Tax=invertebrate metagenome TaxID=1711999 RepID=A0A484H655_9ZZZZ
MDEIRLRRGWTTGACAAAAAKAACLGLASGRAPQHVTVQLPHGLAPAFAVHHSTVTSYTATASVIKDAGDDPDVTHGAEIVVAITLASAGQGPAGQGLVFQAGTGVGLVTRPGLPLAVGEPAINPCPRAMITHNLSSFRTLLPPDLSLTLSITNGDNIARNTLNNRLGIVGGLSILGTTGVVIPYSCSAWMASIQQGVNVARAAGLAHIAGATGRTSERAVQLLHDLPSVALVSMGDFVGALLQYLRHHPLPRLTLAGGFAKLVKLAQGELDLHSDRCRFEPILLARLARDSGASASLTALLAAASSARQALALAQAAGIDLAASVAGRARTVAAAVVGPAVCVDVALFDRDGTLLAVGCKS